MTREVFTRNILDEVYEALVNDEQLLALVPVENVWKRNIQEESRNQSPVVRITQTGWLPYDYSSNKQKSYLAEFQIDVWQRQEDGDPYLIGQIIQAIMGENNFQQNTPAFDYDPDTDMLRDGRRYAGYIII